MDKTFDDCLNEGKSFFVKKNYFGAQIYFVKAAELNPEFISNKYKKTRKLGIGTNDYLQECLDKGITSILDDIDDSLSKINPQDMFNPFDRNFNLKQTQIIALLKDYAFILNCCLKHSSKSKYWAYEYKLLGDIYIKLDECQIAYSYYKKALYFNKNIGVLPIFKKIAKIYGKEDELEDTAFNYKLIKNIYFKELNNVPTNNKSKSKYRFELDGEYVSVEEISMSYYKKQGYDVMHSENDFWWFLSSLLFRDLNMIDSHFSPTIEFQYIQDPDIYLDESKDYNFEIHKSNNPQSFQDELNKRVSESYKYDFEDFVKKYYSINNAYPDYIEFLGFDKTINILKSMEFNKSLQLSKELASHDPQKLPTSGFPDLIVWNENTFFFVEVKSTNDKLSEKQIWWHLYISEELNIPIIIFMVNKNKKQANVIKKQYLIK